MHRVLALLTFLAAVLVTSGLLARAQADRAMDHRAQTHVLAAVSLETGLLKSLSAHHVTAEACKQACAAVALLPRMQHDPSPDGIVPLTARPTGRLPASLAPDPSERPPKPLA